MPVEDDPSVSFREHPPSTMIAVIAVCDGHGHLDCVVSDFIESIDLLDDGALDHVVVPHLSEVVVVLDEGK